MSYQPPNEGDALDSTTTPDVIYPLATAVNTLGRGNLVRQALRRDHIPSAIKADYDFNAATKTGLSTMGRATVPFNNQIDSISASPTAPDTIWQVFHGGLPKPPYGPATSFDTGWRIVDRNGFADTNHAAERRFTSRRFVDEALIVNFSADFVDVGTPGANQGDAIPVENVALLLGIGIEVATGQRFVIRRSIRMFDKRSFRHGDVGTFTKVVDADLTDLEEFHQITAGTAQAVAVFAVIAAGKYNFGRAPADDDIFDLIQPGALIGNYNFDILPVPTGGV